MASIIDQGVQVGPYHVSIGDSRSEQSINEDSLTSEIGQRHIIKGQQPAQIANPPHSYISIGDSRSESGQPYIIGQQLLQIANPPKIKEETSEKPLQIAEVREIIEELDSKLKNIDKIFACIFVAAIIIAFAGAPVAAFIFGSIAIVLLGAYLIINKLQIYKFEKELEKLEKEFDKHYNIIQPQPIVANPIIDIDNENPFTEFHPETQWSPHDEDDFIEVEDYPDNANPNVEQNNVNPPSPVNPDYISEDYQDDINSQGDSNYQDGPIGTVPTLGEMVYKIFN